MPTPTWDLFLTVFFIAGTAYGMLMQRERTIVTMMAIYAAIVVTSLLAEPVSAFFAGERTLMGAFFIRSSASPFMIQAGLFMLILVLIIAKSGLTGAREYGGLLSPFEVFSYSFLNTALVTTTLMSFMPEDAQARIIDSSNMAGFLVDHQTWWLVLPIISLIFFGWSRRPLLPS